jgi:hypothetical protein
LNSRGNPSSTATALQQYSNDSILLTQRHWPAAKYRAAAKAVSCHHDAYSQPHCRLKRMRYLF